MAEAPEIFIRKKSGFVRTMGPHDALIFNMICIGFFTASMFSFQMSPFAFPGANITWAFLLCIVLTTPLYLVWASMSSSMPRTGGDYIYQSRIVHPALAFTASFSFTVFWQYWYDASFAMQVVIQSIVPPIVRWGYLTHNPALLELGYKLSTPFMWWVLTAVVLFLSMLAAMPGLPFYVKLQRVLFGLTCVGVVTIYSLYWGKTPDVFAAKFNDFMTFAAGEISASDIATYSVYKPIQGPTDWYNYITAVAYSEGYELVPYNWWDTFGAVPVTLMCMGYGFWTIFVFSEVKRAEDFGLAVYQMELALIIMGFLFAGLNSIMIHACGREFYNALFYLYMLGHEVIYKIPVVPNYVFLADILSPNYAASILLAIGTAAAAVCLVIQIVIVISRMLLAMTFDRLFPEKLGYVGTKWVSPVYANISIFLVDLVFAYVGCFWPTFIFYTSAAVLGAWLAYLIDAISAVIFKWRMPDVYRASAVSKYEIAGIPLTTIVGVLTIAYCGFIMYYYIVNPALGVTYLPSLLLVISVYVGGVIYFYIRRWYMKWKYGINIDLAFTMIPPE